jgi:hypothetical protein
MVAQASLDEVCAERDRVRQNVFRWKFKDQRKSLLSSDGLFRDPANSVHKSCAGFWLSTRVSQTSVDASTPFLSGDAAGKEI